MLYLIIRPLARVFLFVFFRKIYLVGKENIPQTGPVILASNHPNAFTEACIYAVIQPRPVHFLTRADVFKNPLANKILRSLNMLPIYRFRDGYSSLQKTMKPPSTLVMKSSVKGREQLCLRLAVFQRKGSDLSKEGQQDWLFLR
ncbi:MAG: 1-acyl-sn-glycerol-3-phosphate acyltransferase [Saprospiraceae bacterium]|nr:1-acyl-sn-glycerol-3-phosphate acyltransferase [Saprospiraceae bacterium]